MAKKAKKQGGKKGAAKKSAKPAKKQAGKKAAAKSAKPAKKAAAKPTKKAAKPAKKAAAKPAKKPKAPKPAKQEFAGEENTNVFGEAIVVEEGSGTTVADLAGKAMIVQILGDAEAYFIDWGRLSPDKRGELVQHHLAAFDRRKREEGKADWAETFVPLALLGESMPPVIRGKFDLSAPHEGVILIHPLSNALLYAASKDDDKLAILAPDLETISPHDSFVSEVFDPEAQTYAYTVDRSQSQGFTLSEIETLMQTGGAELTLV